MAYDLLTAEGQQGTEVLKLADLAIRDDFRLGPLSVSPSLRSIKGPAGETHVEPLIMQVLVVLADAKGQVVTRTRLFDECWGGYSAGDYSLNRAITMVRRIASETGPGAFTIESIPRTGYRLLISGEGKKQSAAISWRSPLVLAACASLVIVVGAAVIILGLGPREPTAQVIASDIRSRELADAIRHGAVADAPLFQAPLRILDSGSASASSDFKLQVRKSAASSNVQVDLNLVSGSDGALLWSWSAKQSGSQAAPVDQQARTIGQAVLFCAAETRDHVTHPPDQETIKLYLDACSKLGSWAGTDLRLLIDAFQRVTERAPDMRGAWGKLIISKAEAIEGLPPMDLKESLKRDIRNAEAHHIDIPEVYGGKATLLPPNARFERLQIGEAALARFPSSPSLLAGHSWLLRSLGRMNDAAAAGQRLYTLYPQSSAASSEYATSLMHSGRIDAARRILDRAEKLSPGAENLQASRWLLEMRYGDPKAALALAREGNNVVEEPMLAFLEARINPTKQNIDRAIAKLMAGYRQYPIEPGWMAQALGTFGRTDDAIRFLLRAVPFGTQSGDGAEMLFRPHMRAVRHDPRFMQIAYNFGVTDYWIRSGILPDFCYDPDLPYDCRKELDKLPRPKPSAATS